VSVDRTSSTDPNATVEADGVKQRLRAEIEQRAEMLIDASHQLHGRPELNHQEHFAHDLLTGILEAEGLTVERSAYGLGTAFVADAGTGGPRIAVLCEYDALPGLGHACGHNIIGAAGLGAGIAAAVLADELDGRVRVMGTPAEEGGGGKVLMARQGAFDDVDAAMMVHPAGLDLTAMNAIAIHELTVTYTGQASHAAAFPHLGRNALDAMVLGYQNVAALRQHIRPNERVHGVFVEAGDKANIVPARTRAQWMIRSPSLRTLQPLKDRVIACLAAGASAAGCEMEVEWQDYSYADMLDNPVMVDLFAANAAGLGRDLADPKVRPGVVGSTDMGNVSYLVPAIHPMIAAGPPTAIIHTPEFAAHAASPAGDRAVIDGAIAMAWTVADLWRQPAMLDAARSSFEHAVARAGGAEAREAALAGSG
jgi:amidohydrolase